MGEDDHVYPAGSNGVENIENTSKKTGKVTAMHKFRQNLVSWKRLTSGQKASVGVIIFLLLAIPVGVFYTLNPRVPKLPYAGQETTPNYSGYIIEFNEDSVIEYKRKTLEDKVNVEELQGYEKNRLLPKHEEAKKDVLSRVDKHSKLIGDYTKVFNGVALQISDQEAEIVKESPHVKHVSPNYEVKANLYDSVSLIRASEVWEREDGSGAYITGSGVNVAVLDTGVDSTHADLGASQVAERDFYEITPESGWHLAVSADGSKYAFIKDQIIYVISSTGQQLNELLLPESEIGVYQIVIDNNYLAYFGYGEYGENAGVSVFDLTTGEHKRIEDTNVIGTMHIYNNFLYYGTGTDSWSDPIPSYDVKDVKFASYDFINGAFKHRSPSITPTNFYTINGAYDRNQVAFPVPENDGDRCGGDIYVFNIDTEQGQSYSPPESGLVIDFKGDEILYIACNATDFDPQAKTYYLYNTSTGTATRLEYIPETSQGQVNGENTYDGLLSKAQDVFVQTSTFNWDRYNNGLIGDEVVYFRRDFNSSKVIIYKRPTGEETNQTYYRLNLALPISRFISSIDTICFGNIGIFCHDYNPGENQYPIPPLSSIFNNKVVSGHNFIYPDDFALDDYGHGTHVAAIVAGNGTLKGIAPGANIIAYKVLNSYGSGNYSSIMSAIEKAASTLLDDDFSNDIHVLNMSLGTSCGSAYSPDCGPDDPASSSVDSAVDAGIVMVISAGNNGPTPSSIGSPGTARKAITVGAVDKNKQMADFSSRGPVVYNGETIQKPDIVAPGLSICAAEWDSYMINNRCIDDQHIAISGTSMAAPHIAGVAALIKQMYPAASPIDIKQAIKNNAFDLDYDVNDQGSGLVDALNSIFPDTSSRVFVTYSEYSGNLGGVVGADAKCQQSADNVGLGGEWKAWLSNSITSVASRFSHSTGPYRLLNGVTIADNWTDLTDGTIQQPINITEFNQNLDMLTNTWTNTTLSGGIYNDISIGSTHCQNWESSSLSDKGGLGYTDSTSHYWTESGYGHCSQLEHLFCFEQVDLPTPTTPPIEPGNVSGKVTLQGRSNHEGVVVIANHLGNGTTTNTRTDGNSNFSFEVSPGLVEFSTEGALYLDALRDEEEVPEGLLLALPSVELLGGDTNDDGVVNQTDLDFIKLYFGKECNDKDWEPKADINADCVINILDASMAGGNFGKFEPVEWSGSSAVTPGPVSPTPAFTPTPIPSTPTPTPKTPSPTPTIIPTITPTPTPVYSIPPTPVPTVPPPVVSNNDPRITTLIADFGRINKNYKGTARGYDVDLNDTLTMSFDNLPKGLSQGSCSENIRRGRKYLTCKVIGRPRESGLFTVTVTLYDDKGGVDRANVYMLIVGI